MRKVTMKDIANKLGVSVSAVSRALSGKPGVSKRLREKIVETAKEMGYHPDPLAVALKKGTTKTIGVLIPELSGSFFAEVVASMEKSLFHLGYRLLLCSTDDDPEKEAEQIKTLINQRVEGILAAPVYVKSNKDLFKAVIEDYKIPLVFFDRIVEGVDTDYVISDNEEGMKAIMEYLISKGHRKIAFIYPLRGTFTGEMRLKAFLKYKDYIETREEWLKDGHSNEYFAHDAFINIMASEDRPTAVVVGNNLMTLGVLKAAREMKLKIPEEISIISFDDAYWNEIFDPPITCVKQDPQQIGLIAATILLNKLKNKKRENQPMQVVLKVKFIERSSVKTIRG
ncbi:LacI family transcriptional regulator [Thermotoga sp. KOL6]|nr:LacI family DNA-binding transcriptional regulator [Thermotoga sp. KOL6]PLV59041.1 LacI family transcriptional regulator [Thermotoga sp. KOL6]